MSTPRTTSTIIVAAGSGTRFGLPKQFADLAGKPLLQWSIETFLKHPEVGEVIVVHSVEHVQLIQDALARITDSLHSSSLATLRATIGGATRQDSVSNGLREVRPEFSYVLVHDAARPLIDQASISAVIDACKEYDAALLALPVVDTLKHEAEGLVEQTVSRVGLWRAQTPQGAKTELLQQAFAKAHEDEYQSTDESELLEHVGIRPKLILGSEENFKVTYPEDLARAERILSAKSEPKEIN